MKHLALALALFGVAKALPLLALAEIVSALGMSLLSGADRALLYAQPLRAHRGRAGRSAYEPAGQAEDRGICRDERALRGKEHRR